MKRGLMVTMPPMLKENELIGFLHDETGGRQHGVGGHVGPGRPILIPGRGHHHPSNPFY
jgi:hypothetical protein